MPSSTFEQEKHLFNNRYEQAKSIECILPVHLSKGKIESNLYKKNGTHNEQYFKWQFLNSFVQAGLCSIDYLGVEVEFPKGNKNAANLKMDALYLTTQIGFIIINNCTQKKMTQDGTRLIG